MGTTDFQVAYEGQTATLPLVVVKEKGPTLLGRNWLSQIRAKFITLLVLVCMICLLNILKFFQENLGSFKGYEARVNVDPNATPRFYKARTVPYAMCEKVEAKLNRLVAKGTLEPVKYSDWAALILAVVMRLPTALVLY